MTGQDSNLARPEEAASWPEFRTRSAAGRAAWGPSRSTGKARSQGVLGVIFGVGALVFLWGATVAASLGMWVLIVLAVFCGWVCGRYLPPALRQGAFGTPRYWKIVLLGAVWRARITGQRASGAAGQARNAAGQVRQRAVGAWEERRDA
jgi:hypothetical protein